MATPRPPPARGAALPPPPPLTLALALTLTLLLLLPRGALAQVACPVGKWSAFNAASVRFARLAAAAPIGGTARSANAMPARPLTLV